MLGRGREERQGREGSKRGERRSHMQCEGVWAWESEQEIRIRTGKRETRVGSISEILQSLTSWNSQSRQRHDCSSRNGPERLGAAKKTMQEKQEEHQRALEKRAKSQG